MSMNLDKNQWYATIISKERRILIDENSKILFIEWNGNIIIPKEYWKTTENYKTTFKKIYESILNKVKSFIYPKKLYESLKRCIQNSRRHSKS